jgi:hypothetical protein
VGDLVNARQQPRRVDLLRPGSMEYGGPIELGFGRELSPGLAGGKTVVSARESRPAQTPGYIVSWEGKSTRLFDGQKVKSVGDLVDARQQPRRVD